MKRLMLVSLLISGMLLLAAPRPARADVAVSVGFFHDELSPYGSWAPCAYGECWVPAGVAAGWQPYSNGEWIDTDFGWTWVSYDPWGGDPYHYGSWVWLDDDDDWGWVPGTIWAPAWVTWCWDGDDIGWAPLGPSFAFTATGFFGSPVIAPARSYVFVPGRQFLASNVSAVRLPAARNAAILPRMHSATAFRVSGGIVRNTALPVSRVERATGRSVPRRSISAARTDPRPVPRVAAKQPLRLASSAKDLRSQIGKTPARSGQTRTAARRPPARSHSTRRSAQPAARRPAPHRAAGHSAKAASRPHRPSSTRAPSAARRAKASGPAKASAHKPARSSPASRKLSPARSRKTETRASARHQPAPRPVVKASSPAHTAPRARKPEPASSARPVRERAPAPVARRAPVEASRPAPQPRVVARPAPEPRAAAHPAPRPMPGARPAPPPRPKEKKPGPQ